MNNQQSFWNVLGVTLLAYLVAAPGSALAGTADYQTEVLADSPYVFYRLNDVGGTAADTSVNGRTGTYINSPTQGVLGLGTSSDNAVTFNGTTQRIEAASLTGFGSLMSSSSFELVFKSGTAFPTNKMSLTGAFNTGSTTAYQVNLNENAQGGTTAVPNSIRLFLRDESGLGVGAAFVHSTILDGNYHHLLFTYDSLGGAGRVQAYVDGVPQAVALGTGSAGGTPATFTNFAFNPSFAARTNRAVNDLFFNGTVDEAALYTSILTASDAVAHAEALGFTVAIPNQWDVDGGGSFNLADNWTDTVVPTTTAIFGSVLTAPNSPATVTVDSPVSLTGVTFSSSNQYIVAGPSAVTLTGAATVDVSGTHQVTADIAGTAGLNKTNGGTLVLAAAKSYTGTTGVTAGILLINSLDAIDNSASGVLNPTGAGIVLLSTGATGTLAAQLTGNGVVNLDDALVPADTVTISRANASFSGLIRVDDGTLVVAHNDALGAGGTVATRTTLDDDSTAKLSLPGGITIANEILDMDGRSTAAIGLTSAGSNSWNGIIDGQSTGTLPLFNIESTSGTLTLGQLHAADIVPAQTFVFSGAGDTTITTRLSEDAVDDAAGNVVPSTVDNVGVIKRGAGNLTVAIGTSGGRVDYWFGPTVIEQGTLTVTDPLVNNQGELRSLDITVRNGATLHTAAFDTYSQQIGQVLRGDGTIVATTLALFDDGSLAPGDSVGGIGSLSVTGNVTLSNVATGGLWNFDVGNGSDTSGDVLAVSGSFTASGAPALTVNVTPAHGHLDAGSRTIVSHTGGTNSAVNGIVAQITDANGIVLNTRQTVAVNGDTSGQVNVVVTGEEATRTWNGNVVGGAWDIATTSNWQQADQQYRDLDHVVFNDTATGTTTVAVDGARHAGSVTFANSSKSYQLTGAGGLTGTGGVTVSGTGQVDLANTGNNFSGSTTVASGGKLQMTSATTGSVTNAGTFSLRTAISTNALLQNGVQTIGAGAYKVFSIEAENFQSQTNNGAVGTTTWGTITTAPADTNAVPAENPLDPSLAGQALIAAPIADNNTTTAVGTQNFATYSLKFTEPGSYYWFGRMRAVDGGAATATGNVPDGLSNNDDSLLLPATDLGNGVADPQTLSTFIDLVQVSQGRAVNAEGTGTTTTFFDYDWYRSGEGALGGDPGFEKIVVSAADVANGSVFQFKVAARETGMVLDKIAFVRSPDFTTDPNFGTITDADLDAVATISSTAPQTVFSPGTVLNVNGNFTMSGNSSNLKLLIGAPDTHDQLNISGTLAADGVLTLEPGNGGLGALAGSVFDIFNFASATGAFDNIVLPTLVAGLAWDTSNLLITGDLAVVAVPLLIGDYNDDGFVDAADYTVWRNNLGTSNMLFNDPIGGMIGEDHYTQWAAHYGEVEPPPGAGGLANETSVPEPATVALLLISGFAGLTFMRRRG